MTTQQVGAQVFRFLSGRRAGVRRRVRQRLAWVVAVALIASFLPWTPPSLTPVVRRAMSTAPQSAQWAVPLALSITGWADRAMASLGSVPVYAGDNITLTLSKRDDGLSLTPLLPVGRDPLVPGSSLIYYIEVTNSGSITATVHLTETLPEGLTCADAWRVPGYDGGADWYLASCSGRQVRLYTLDEINSTFFDGLGPGRSAVLYVWADVQWPLEDGHVFTNATTSYEASASQEPAYTYSGTSEVTTTVEAPRLAIAKTVSPQQAWIGEEITFTLAVSNSGHYALTAPFTLTVVDPLPAGSSLVRYTSFPGTAGVVASASAVTWTVPFASGGNADLAPGETLTATLVVAASQPFTHASYMTNTGYSVSISPTDLTTPTLVSGEDVSVQVLSHPSLTVTKAGPASPVYVSEDWTYWITVTNASDAMGNAVGLVITDAVPVNTVLQSAGPGQAQSAQYDCMVAGCVITWTYPAAYSLSWGESTAVSFTVRAAPGVISGTVVTNALYGATASNVERAADGAPVTTWLWGDSHLQAVKSAQPTLVIAAPDRSDVITFTIDVTNLDDATAEAVDLTITDTVPSGTELVSAGFAVGTGTVLSPSLSAGSVVTWTVGGPLARGAGITASMIVHVSTPIDDGSVVSNRGFVSARRDYTETGTVAVTVSSAPDLHIAKAASAATIVPGEYLTYTITYTNSGTMNAYHTVLTDTLPDTAYVNVVSTVPTAAQIGDQLVWDLDTVQGHDGSTPGTGSVTAVLTVTRPLTNGTVLTNTAAVSSDEGGYTVTGDVTTTVSSAIDLALAKLPDNGLAEPGEVIAYSILYTNTADATSNAIDLTVTDLLPSYILGGTASRGPDLGTIAAGATVTWYVPGPLTPGEGGLITLWLTTANAIPDLTVLTNTARIVGGQGVWAEDSAVYTVRSPDIAVSKSATPATVRAGEPVTFTVVFSNVGGAAARNVRITDTLPISLTLIGSSETGATFVGRSGQDYVWFADPVPAGSGGAITLTAQVTATPGWISPAGTTHLTNVVLASAALDVDLSDNGDIRTVTVVAGTAGSLSLNIVPSTLLVPGPAAITITLSDAYGNPTYNGDAYTVDLGSVPAGATLGSAVVGISNGQATTTISSTVAGTYQVTGAVTSLPAVSATAPVTFVASTLDRFAIAPIGDQTAGISFTVSITAVDQFGNRMPGFTGPVQIRDTAAPNTLQPPITALFDQGLLASQPVTITLARANRAIEVYTGTVTSASQPFTVSVGALGQVTVTTSASMIRLGENATASVVVADAYSNRVPGDLLSFGISPVGTVYPATATSNASGTATFAISSTVVASATVVVTASNGLTGTAPVSFIPGAPAAITVTIVPSTTPVGSSAAITVEVRDAYGNGVNWDTVNLTADPLGSGSIWPATAMPLDANGRATSAISSTIPGPKTVRATAQSNARTATAVVTFTVGAAQSIDLVMSPNPQQVGLNASLSATVRDAFGNPRTGDVITFSVAAGALGGGGVIPTVGTTDAQGVATTSISSTVATVTPVTATLAGPGPVLSNTEMAAFVAGPPTAITLTVSPAEVEAGLSATLTATMTDQYGNACQGQQATFTVAPSQYVLSGPGVNTWIVPNPATADGSGLVTAAISSTLVGQVTVTVQGPSAYTSTAVLTIIPGALHHFLVTAVPDPVVAGGVYPLEITAADESGSALTTATGWISITDQTGTILPTAVWMVNGLANVDWTITRPMISDWIDLHWASNPAISATTNLFTVTVGPPNAVALDYASVMTACQSQVITATVRDAYDNLVPGVDVEVLSLGVGSITPGGVIRSDANGIVTTTFSSNQAGAAVVRFSVGGAIPVAAIITVEASAPTALDLVASPGSIMAGGSAALVATVTDCGGNGVPNQVISATIVSGYGTLTPPAGTTDTSGQVGFTLTATRTGTVYVRAFDAATGLVEDTVMVTVGPGCPQSVAMSANPQAIGANGGRSTVVATVLDAYGNPLAGRWVAFSTSGALGTVNPSGGTTDAAGMVTTTLTSASQLGSISVVGTVSEAFCPAVSGTAVVHVGGSVVYLPVVMRQYSNLDLRVASIQAIPAGGGQYEVRVTIENVGRGMVASPFWVDLYMDPSGPIAVNVLWNHVCSYGKAWYVRQTLLPGQQLVLSTKDPDDPSNPGDRYSNWPGQFSGSDVHTLYALADSYGLPSVGAVIETSETNNLMGPVTMYSVSASTAPFQSPVAPLSVRPVPGE